MKAIRGGGVRGLHGERLRLLRTRPFRDAIVASLVVLLLWTPFIIWNLWYTSNTQVQAFNDRLQLFGTAISTSMAESATLLQRLLQWRLDGVDKDWQSPAAAGLFSDWRSYCSGSLGAFAVEGSEPRLLSVSAAVAAVPIIEQAVADRFPELLQRMRDRRAALRAGEEGELHGIARNPVIVSHPFQLNDRWLIMLYGETERQPEAGGSGLLLLLDLGNYVGQLLRPSAGSPTEFMRFTIFDERGNRLLGPEPNAEDFPCTHSLQLPGAQWRIDGVPQDGWVIWSSGLILTNVGAVFSMATAAGLVMFLHSRVRARFATQLEQSNQRLSDALGQRMSSERARDQALADLARSRQLESVGRLAGGVAHEFNNLLQVILGHTDLLLGEFPLDRPVSDGLRQVDRAGRRAAELTKQLLEFAKREPQESAVVDIVSAVSEGLRLMKPALKKSTRLNWIAPETQMFVPMDALHLDQVILNLLLNADLAMPGGGEIELCCGEVAAGESAGAAGVCEHRSVVLTIADNGCGMSEDVLTRVFDPFFSTRGPSDGTGLGLSLVYSLMRQCGGRVHLSSAEGQGTTVTLVFPWCVA